MQSNEIRTIQIADRIYYEIVSHCNLKCIHCSDMQSAIPYTQINTEALYKFHERLSSKIEINSVVITGGEPTLHQQFDSILEFFLKKRLLVMVTTNGLALNKEKLGALLAKYPNLRIQFSVDGVTREVYENVRGVNTWEKLKATLDYFAKQKQSRQVGISMTILKQNQHQVLDAVQFAEELRFGFIHFPVLLCIGAAKRRWNEIAPNAEKQLEIERSLFTMISNYSGELVISSNRLEQIISSISSEGQSHCGHSPTLKISSDGSIYTCPAAYGKAIGNIENLDVVDSLPSILSECLNNLPISRKQCQNCEVYNYCLSRFCANCMILAPTTEQAFQYTCSIVKKHYLDALEEIRNSVNHEDK